MSHARPFNRRNTVAKFGRMLRRARNLTRTLGARCAAGYLRNKGLPFEVTYIALFNREPRII